MTVSPLKRSSEPSLLWHSPMTQTQSPSRTREKYSEKASGKRLICQTFELSLPDSVK